jgi:hypothetical protein
VTEDIASLPGRAGSSKMTLLAVLLGLVALGGCAPIVLLLILVPDPPFVLMAWMIGSLVLGCANLWICVRYLGRRTDRGSFFIYAANSALIVICALLVWP